MPQLTRLGEHVVAVCATEVDFATVRHSPPFGAQFGRECRSRDQETCECDCERPHVLIIVLAWAGVHGRSPERKPYLDVALTPGRYIVEGTREQSVGGILRPSYVSVEKDRFGYRRIVYEAP